MKVATKKGAPKHLKFAVLAADVCVFTVADGVLKVLLTPVNRPPHYANREAMPGGLIDPSETAEEAAVRIARDKGSIDLGGQYMEQLATFSRIDRDPRGRVISVAYLALVPPSMAKDDEKRGAQWVSVKQARHLAYDHDEMLHSAHERLKSKLAYTNAAYALLPDEFTMGELQALYECILGCALDKRNFRKKIAVIGLVKPTGKKRRSGASRPAELFKFVKCSPQMIEIL